MKDPLIKSEINSNILSKKDTKLKIKKNIGDYKNYINSDSDSDSDSIPSLLSDSNSEIESIVKVSKKYSKLFLNKNNKLLDSKSQSLDKNFYGSIKYNPYSNHIKCIFCDRFYPSNMYLKDTDYCAHCWAWLNNEQFNLYDGIYKGDNTFNEIIDFLKLTFPLHTTLCSNSDCIYNKINNLMKENKLNKKFYILFNDCKNNKITKKEIKEYKLIKPRCELNINYKLSSIII